MQKPRPGIIVLAVKIGPKILSILGKLAPKLTAGKFILAGASFASYALLFSWKFALLLMVSLAIHESGHVFAMRQYGIKTKGFYFIPFVGGAAVADEAFPSRTAEAYVALMGPVWGFFTACVPAIVYWVTKTPLFAASASWIAMVNLFNLLPVNPLDGGRVAKSLAFSAGTKTGYIYFGTGVLMCLLLAIITKIWLFAALLIVGGLEAWSELRARKRFESSMPSREDLLAQQKEMDDKQMLMPGTALENYAKLPADFHHAKMIVEDRLEQWKDFDKRFGGMPRTAVLYKVGAYLSLVLVLFIMMHAMSHVPEADVALQFLKS